MSEDAVKTMKYFLSLTNSKGLKDQFQDISIEDYPSESYAQDGEFREEDNTIEYASYEKYLKDLLHVISRSRGEESRFTVKALKIKGLYGTRNHKNAGMDQELFATILDTFGKGF